MKLQSLFKTSDFKPRNTKLFKGPFSVSTSIWFNAWSIASSTLVHLFWFLRCCSSGPIVLGDQGKSSDSGAETTNFGELYSMLAQNRELQYYCRHHGPNCPYPQPTGSFARSFGQSWLWGFNREKNQATATSRILLWNPRKSPSQGLASKKPSGTFGAPKNDGSSPLLASASALEGHENHHLPALITFLWLSVSHSLASMIIIMITMIRDHRSSVSFINHHSPAILVMCHCHGLSPGIGIWLILQYDEPIRWASNPARKKET